MSQTGKSDCSKARAVSHAPASARGRLYIQTYGCQMNEYDSLKLEKILEPQYDRVSSPEEADLVLVNTCSVRDKPEQKVYSLLGGLRQLKRSNPALMIGVGGCVAQQEGDRIVKRSPVVDFVFGTHNLSLVPSLIERRRSGLPPQVAVDYRDEWEEIPVGFAGQGRVSAFVSISRGCNKNCTYCIVPTTRGPEVSRSMDEIEREVRLAVHRGAREIILLGQTVNSYGRDFSPRQSFASLLERIAAVENLWRIRFTSPHPQEIREDFISLMADTPKICRHVHMPLQSGSDSILRGMNRNYRRHRYLEIIGELKSRVPDIAITTDIIVGFPGESEDDFSQTLEVMDIVGFENSYSFMFSPRPGTAAAAMADTVPSEEKLRRLQAVQLRQEEITQTKLMAWVGKPAEVLIEGSAPMDTTCMQGRISQNFVLSLEQPEPTLSLGSLALVDITRAMRHSLKGSLVRVLRP